MQSGEAFNALHCHDHQAKKTHPLDYFISKSNLLFLGACVMCFSETFYPN